MTKHTPGPWAVKGVGEVIVCETGETLCDVYSSPAAGEEQADTDAHLIAVAPDLLAACELLLEAQRKAVAGESGGFELYFDAVELARAAVEKLKGGN